LLTTVSYRIWLIGKRLEWVKKDEVYFTYCNHLRPLLLPLGFLLLLLRILLLIYGIID